MTKHITLTALFLCFYTTILPTAAETITSIAPQQVIVRHHRQNCWQRLKAPLLCLLLLGVTTGAIVWGRLEVSSRQCQHAYSKFSSLCNQEPKNMTGRCWGIAALKCPGYFEGAEAEWCPLNTTEINTTETVTASDLLKTVPGQTFIGKHPGARLCVVHGDCQADMCKHYNLSKLV